MGRAGTVCGVSMVRSERLSRSDPANLLVGGAAAVVLVALVTAVVDHSARTYLERFVHALPLVLGAAFYLLAGLVSAAIVGGTQGLVGLKIDYFWFLLAIAAWRAPLDARDRDRIVSILILDGVITSLYGLWQQAVGAGPLLRLGYK